MGNSIDLTNRPATASSNITDPPWGYGCPKGSGMLTPLMPELKFSWYDPGGLNGGSTVTPIEKWVGPENFEMYFNAHRRLTWNCPVDNEPIRPMHGYWPKASKPGMTYAQRLSYENTFYTDFLKRYYSSEPWGNPSWSFDDLQKRWRYDQNKPNTHATGGGRRSWLWPPFKWYCRPEFEEWKQDGWQWIQDWCYDALYSRPCSWVWEHPTTDLLFHPALHDGGPDQMDFGRPYGGKQYWDTWDEWYESDPAWTGTENTDWFSGKNWTDGHHFEGTPFGYGAALGHPVGYIALWKVWTFYCGLHSPAPGVTFSHGTSYGAYHPWPTSNDSEFFHINILLHARMAGFDNADPDLYHTFACGDRSDTWNIKYLLEWHLKEGLTSLYGGTDWFASGDPSGSNGPEDVLPWISGPSYPCADQSYPGRINPINDRVDPDSRDWYWPDRASGTNYHKVPQAIRNYSPLPFLAFINARDLYNYVKDNTGWDLFDPNLMNGITEYIRDAKRYCEHMTTSKYNYFSIGISQKREAPMDWFIYRPHQFCNLEMRYTFPSGTLNMESDFGLPAGTMNDMREDAANGYNECIKIWDPNGYQALDVMAVMREIETIPGEYIWLHWKGLGTWDAIAQKWGLASYTPSSWLWGIPAFMTMLGGQHPRGRAIVELNPRISYLPDVKYPSFPNSVQHGWPSVFPGSNVPGTSWVGEVCSFLDYFAKQYIGEADSVEVDLQSVPAESYSESTDAVWDSGSLLGDLANVPAESLGRCEILGYFIEPPFAGAYSECGGHVISFGSDTINLAGSEANSYGEVTHDFEKTISLGIANMYGEAISPPQVDAPAIRVDLQGDESNGYSECNHPVVTLGGDLAVSLEGAEAISWSESTDGTWATGSLEISLVGEEMESYAESMDPDVSGDGPMILNPTPAEAYQRVGVDSPIFGYDLTYNTTGEEYTLGGT